MQKTFKLTVTWNVDVPYVLLKLMCNRLKNKSELVCLFKFLFKPESVMFDEQ